MNAPDDERATPCTRAQLDAYLARVGHDRPVAADAATLAALHRAHVARIAFENLELHLGRPMRIAPDALFEDLVLRRRGGYCFQMNELFARVLLALGFRVERFAARVWHGAPARLPPRSHQLLRVATARGERFLADVGFGGSVPLAPLPWEPGRVECQSVGDYALEAGTPCGTALRHRVDGEAWAVLYSFDEQDTPPVDFVALNHAVATLADSFFVLQRVAARTDDGVRQGLCAGRYSEWRAGVRSERAVDPHEEERLYREVFGLDLPDELPWFLRPARPLG